MKFKILLVFVSFVILVNSLNGCIENDKPNPITLGELYGSWSYVDEQYKTMTWVFFENNSVLTDFYAKGGSSLKVWYSYKLDGQDLCFTDFNTSQEFCYDYDYTIGDNDYKLEIIQGENIAVFVRNQ